MNHCCNMHLCNRIANKRYGNFSEQQEIRSAELRVCPMQLFHFWSRDVHTVQNLLMCTKCHKIRWFLLRYGDITIIKMAAVRHLGIVLPPYETTQEVWLGVWGLWTPKCDYSSSSYSSLRPPKGTTSLHKYASFKLSTVKIRWGVWPVGELTESVTDTYRYTHTHR